MPSRTALTRCKAGSKRLPSRSPMHQRPPSAWIAAVVLVVFALGACVIFRMVRTQEQEGEQSLEYSIDQVLSLDNDSEVACIEPGSYTTTYGTVLVQREEADVVEVASTLLESYQTSGEVALVYAEYLDLFGNVWAGILQGDTWIEICLVMERDSYCDVRVVRLDSEQIETLEDIGGDIFEEL